MHRLSSQLATTSSLHHRDQSRGERSRLISPASASLQPFNESSASATSVPLSDLDYSCASLVDWNCQLLKSANRLACEPYQVQAQATRMDERSLFNTPARLCFAPSKASTAGVLKNTGKSPSDLHRDGSGDESSRQQMTLANLFECNTQYEQKPCSDNRLSSSYTLSSKQGRQLSWIAHGHFAASSVFQHSLQSPLFHYLSSKSHSQPNEESCFKYSKSCYPA